uniref:Uncharacterized protein n=1 Tax=Anopheles minimus TaxID=112268 RepID=A0A182WNR4_9DIPT
MVFLVLLCFALFSAVLIYIIFSFGIWVCCE